MSSKSLGTLTLDIVAETGGFVKGMDKAQRRSERWRKQVRRDLKRVGSAFAVAGAAAVGAFSAMAAQTINSTRELERFAQLSDTSTQDFQRMAYGAERLGVEEDKLADILKDVNDRIGDFRQTGAGPMADFFENIAPKVGVTADQFARLSGPEALQLYVSSLEKAGLSQKDMTFYMEAIASDASALIPLLQNGGAEMARFGDEAERTGNVFNEMEFQQLQQAKAGIDELTGAATGMKNEMVLGALPAINELVDTLGDSGTAENARVLGRAIATSMNWAVKAIDHVIGGWVWLSEELAAWVHGPGLHDIERLREQVEDQEALIDRMTHGPAQAPQSMLDKELTKLEEYNARLEQGIALQDMMMRGPSAGGNQGGLGGAIDPAAIQSSQELSDLLSATQERQADASEAATEATESNARATDDARQAVEHFSRSAIDGARAIQRAASFDWSGDPGAYGADQPSSVQERINSRRDPGVINYQANPNAHSTWGGDLGSSRMNSAVSSVNRSDSGNRRNLGTLTLKSENGDIDVEANSDELSKWLASTLSGTAAAT